jgi:hypothetical protein
MSNRHPWLPVWLARVALVLLTLVVAGCTSTGPTPFQSPVLPTAQPAASPLPATQVATRPTEAPAPVSPLPTPVPTWAPATPSAGKGSIKGSVSHVGGGQIPPNTQVFVAKFVWDPKKTSGVFFLDPEAAVGIPVDSAGNFQVRDLDPGTYVLVVGTTPMVANAIIGDSNQARVIDVVAGQVIDLGHQSLPLR